MAPTGGTLGAAARTPPGADRCQDQGAPRRIVRPRRRHAGRVRSVVDGVRCAVEVQRGMPSATPGTAGQADSSSALHQPRRPHRRGRRHLRRWRQRRGAARGRWRSPVGICVGRSARDQVRDKLGFTFEDIGEQAVKNIGPPDPRLRVRSRASSPRMRRRGPPRHGASASPRCRGMCGFCGRWRRSGMGTSPNRRSPPVPRVPLSLDRRCCPSPMSANYPEQENFADASPTT